MELILTEIDKISQDLCPYIFKSNELKIDWDLLKDSEIFLWYSPVNLNEYSLTN